MTNSRKQLKNHMISMEKIVTNLSEGSSVCEKPIYTLIVEPAPAFLGTGVQALLKFGIGVKATAKNSLFADGEKKSLHFLRLYSHSFR